MQIFTDTPDQYVAALPDDRKEAITALRQAILQNLPPGFQEAMSYGMIGYVVPHLLYPAGYHCDPKLPLPFMSIASQKNFVAVYHMGIYADPVLMDWFTAEYAKRVKGKLDMGKSCVRFKKPSEIPVELIGELASKMTVQDWVSCYENAFRKK
ncbi:MAG: DUF1801 domain-containing protein [Saprospiraceae bacterium]|nr:DUF1801 domain-containing protein [Saprospiraceae bacterium]